MVEEQWAWDGKLPRGGALHGQPGLTLNMLAGPLDKTHLRLWLLCRVHSLVSYLPYPFSWPDSDCLLLVPGQSQPPSYSSVQLLEATSRH